MAGKSIQPQPAGVDVAGPAVLPEETLTFLNHTVPVAHSGSIREKG